MVLNISTDIAKLPPAKADRFVSGLMARLGARCEQTTTYEAATGSVVSGRPGA
jgi:hypothetical protein